MIKTSDIIIYTTPEKLLHKQGKMENDPDKSDFNEYYWELPYKPKGFGNDLYDEDFDGRDRIYFATKGMIRGYFTLLEFDDSIDCFKFIFDCRSWKDLDKPISTKPFQGFKYADKIPQLKE